MPQSQPRGSLQFRQRFGRAVQGRQKPVSVPVGHFQSLVALDGLNGELHQIRDREIRDRLPGQRGGALNQRFRLKVNSHFQPH